MRVDRRVLAAALLLALLACACSAGQMAPRVLLAREGKGYLESVGTQLVLHLKGSPAEMGRQQGVLLKDHIQAMISTVETRGKGSSGPMLDMVWRHEVPFLPQRYVDEMKALAEASGVEFDRVRRANSIPELFHCSGFAVFGKATKGGALYHGRILDYGVGLGLQDHAVVVIAEPDGFSPFANVTYAGFLGSVTGMNLKSLGFGEMGGRAVGPFDGTPMAFLMRRGLEEAGTLEQAKKLFRESKRTCEYYYVISDAKLPSAVGVSATAHKIEFVGPNQAKAPLDVPIRDAVVLSAGDRYQLLTQRIKDKWGKLDATACLELMRRPVSMAHCLHAVLMAPGTGEMWVAHATSKGEPASEQPYTYLNITELMSREP